MSETLYERILDLARPPIVIAEAGINHNGDIELARRLVVEAADAGADVVKFQTHLPAHEMVREGPTAAYVEEPLFDLLERMVLTADEHRELMGLAETHGCQFLSTPFSREAADLLDELGVPMFKIGSGEASNIPLLAHVAGLQKPIILSTGMTNLGEVDEAVAAITEVNPRIVLLHCTSTYPTAYEDVRLPAIQVMQDRYKGVPIGLSDHTPDVFTALGATALGARVIEKHFTASREWQGPDQQVSLEPDELGNLVKGTRAVHAAMQVATKSVLEPEIEVQQMARESVVSIRNISAGEILDENAIWVKRPGTGIPAREYAQVIGRRVRRDIDRDKLLQWTDFE